MLCNLPMGRNGQIQKIDETQRASRDLKTSRGKDENECETVIGWVSNAARPKQEASGKLGADEPPCPLPLVPEPA